MHWIHFSPSDIDLVTYLACKKPFRSYVQILFLFLVYTRTSPNDKQQTALA
ncbi:hypothetical protein ABP1_4106 [Bacillus subtilis]|nr:hypothetical protein ABP1_4106 [Bacillus subtilis]